VSEAYLKAREAAELLGVKLPTLYAYVSRGQLTSVPGPGRAKRYRRADLEALRLRRGGARAREGSAQPSPLRWGEPVLDSSITEVVPGGHRYRGQSAIELAEQDTRFEDVAELLWTGSLPPEPAHWPRAELPLLFADPSLRSALGPDARAEDAPPLARLALLIPALALGDPARYGNAPAALLPRGRALIRAMAEALGGLGDPDLSVAECLAHGLCPRRKATAAQAFNRGLVLWADHELNVSSFAARVAASAGADLYSCVSAGLAALSGPRHGGACDQIEALLEEIRRPERADEVLNERARRGEILPGFDHPLYPEGDPRALPLLETATELGGARVRLVEALVKAQRARGHEPTVDVGFVALCAGLKLRPGSAPGLVAVGRAAGWIAHVAEQHEAGFLIRPRARYRSR
tara:strand:- start:931 stop:2151 length:1221 start_codon:yes stop_codon:yes gene_type:complete